MGESIRIYGSCGVGKTIPIRCLKHYVPFRTASFSSKIFLSCQWSLRKKKRKRPAAKSELYPYQQSWLRKLPTLPVQVKSVSQIPYLLKYVLTTSFDLCNVNVRIIFVTKRRVGNLYKFSDVRNYPRETLKVIARRKQRIFLGAIGECRLRMR